MMLSIGLIATTGFSDCALALTRMMRMMDRLEAPGTYGRWALMIGLWARQSRVIMMRARCAGLLAVAARKLLIRCIARGSLPMSTEHTLCSVS